MQQTITFLIFAGNQFGKAEEAMQLHTTPFNNTEIKSIHYFKAGR